jgi:hypothetical protein
MTFVRTVARLTMMALAAAVFIGLITLYAHSFGPPSPRERERRNSEPQLKSLPTLLQQYLVFGAIALAGRKILRLRLTLR